MSSTEHVLDISIQSIEHIPSYDHLISILLHKSIEKSVRSTSERRPASINLPIPEGAHAPPFYSTFPTSGFVSILITIVFSAISFIVMEPISLFLLLFLLSLYYQPPYANLFPSLPSDASPTLFLEGVPSDATEREISRILFQYSKYDSDIVVVAIPTFYSSYYP